VRRCVKGGIRLLALAVALGGCTVPSPGPSFAARPGPGKPVEAFSADDVDCRQFAEAQTMPGVEAANQQSFGSALITTMLGAGLGGAIGGGRGAAIGAASGAAVGTVVGANTTAWAQGGLQRQYDVVYAQCMAAKGDQVLGLVPPPGPPPPPPGMPLPPPGS
jgi:hypothetical protein